jgi:N-acetyl-gamma-glutamyl-phosphate reductase
LYTYATYEIIAKLFLITAAIIGASGYSGVELLRLLLAHGEVIVKNVIANASVGKRVAELYPSFAEKTDLVYEAFNPDTLSGVDVAFIALPSGEAMNIVPLLMGKVGRIIDLGGDYRLPMAELYERFYHHTHSSPHLLNAVVYGLPELNKTRIADARLVANPGCYPTSAILAILPALRKSVIVPNGIIVDSLSGVSGAGRSASVELSFVEINENARAYRLGVHQHIPEIESVLSFACNRLVSISFVPHLVPLTRGIYTTIHAKLLKTCTENDLVELYTTFYVDQPFVRITRQIPQIRDVVYTNFCDIAFHLDQRTNQLILISVLDNLIKGAAGQAVQNMNIMFNFPETQGLLAKEKQYVS